MENETKSKETGDRKRKIDEIHNDLRYDLAFKHLDGQSSKKFRGAAWKHLNHADRSYTEPFEILDRLESTGNFAPGKYGLVREIGEKIEEKSFVEAINEAEKRIAKIDTEDDDQPKPRNDKITNIIDQTKKELEDHLSDSSYVPLHVVDHIKKVLHRKGLVVLVGPSGCGKSKSVLQILSKVKKGRVLKLQSLHDWPEMVQVAFENWVWFDDVFEKDPVDKNRSVMATISACVTEKKGGDTDKRTKVLFTVVSEVFEQYRFVLDLLLSAESIINFSDPQYELTLEMKYEILHAHLRANDITIRHGLRPSGHASPVSDENAKYIYEDDAQEILLKRPICGFPQSCHIFCKNPTFLLRGHKFFDDPPKELLQVLKNMLSSKGEQFVILLYAFKNSGQIDLDFLNEHQMSILFNEVSVPLPRNIESCIRKHVEDLRGKFLVERNLDIFEFPHSSIQRAVALSYSKLSKRAKLEVISMLSTATIVDLVKPRSESDHVDSSVINVSRESYSDLADHFTQRITEGDLALFKCSVFHNEEFISMFVPSYLESSEKSISSQLRFIFRYGMINLAKSVLVAWHSTVDDLKDNDYESFMKESSIHRHSTAVQYLINERQESFQKTTSMIKCLECSIQNDEITSILVRNLSINKLDNTQEKAILKVVTRNESLTSFQFFIETARMQSEMLGYVADLAGRRNAHNCINFLLERYSSDMNDIIIDSTRGACKGGHDRLIDWAIEHFPELIKNKAADFLQHVELPSTLEKLHLRYNSVISKLEFSEALNTLCGKGKSLCVKVLLDRCDIFSIPDIQNAMRAAVKKGHLKTVNVIMETFSVPHEMVSELIETVRQSNNMRPQSAYPFTPAHTPASVLSQNMFTPCSFEQTQKRHSKALCLKRAKSVGYLSEEENVYRRAYQTLCTIRDNNKDRESKLQLCEELIKSIPEKYEDLMMQSALHSLHDEELFSIFLTKYSTIWKAVFSACRNERKQIKDLLYSTMKHYRSIRQPFLPSLIDFAIQTNENISDTIHLLIEIEFTFDVEEFNSTLSNLIVTQKEIAKILVQHVEEMTSENSVFLPLTMCCRSNKIDVFKFIWDNISNQKDIFFDLLSKDIVDKDGQALKIMLPDIVKDTTFSEVFLECFQKRARKWISCLSCIHKKELLDSNEFVKSKLFKENESAALVLLVQYLDESNCLLKQAREETWEYVIHLEKNKSIGDIFLETIDILVRTKHCPSLGCLEEFLDRCNISSSQSYKILDKLVTNQGTKDTISTLLRRVVLIPHFATFIFSHATLSAIGYDYFIKNVSQILGHIQNNEGLHDDVIRFFRDLPKYLTVHQKDRIIETLLESCSLHTDTRHLLSQFVPSCREINHDLAKRTITVFLDIDNAFEDDSYCLLYLFDTFPFLISNDELMNSIYKILNDNIYTSHVKKKAFEAILERGIDISYTVRDLFYYRCSEYENDDDFLSSTDEFIQHLIEKDYIDQRQRVEGFKICFFQEDIKNQALGRMIMRKDKTTLPFDKSDIFTSFCKSPYRLYTQTLDCVVELYRDDIDDCALEAGIHILLRYPAVVIRSTVIEDTIVDRGVNIAPFAISLFTFICEDFHSDDINQSKILGYIMENHTDIIKRDIKAILTNERHGVKVKEKAFYVFRERGIDISATVCELFYDRCSTWEDGYFLRNTDRFIKHLIEKGYIDQRQRIDGFQICFFREDIKNQAIARMIMRKDKSTLPFDKSDIFKRICKCTYWWNTETVDCALKLYRDKIDDRSLETGIHVLLQDPTSVLLSAVIVDTIIDRRVDIASTVSSLFTCICEPDYDFADNNVELLKYIMERYNYIISKHLIEGFNVATMYNVKAAIEICKVFPERIKLNEYIILLFLVDIYHGSADHIELINRLSDILRVDKTTCMKFAEMTIHLAYRWRELRVLFGDSITGDMTWKLLCLCCQHRVDETKEILKYSDIKLTPEQIAYLKENYRYSYSICLPNEWLESC